MSLIPIPGAVLEPTALAIAVAVLAILIVALGLAGSVVHARLLSRAVAEAGRLRAHVLDLEATQERLEQTSEGLRLALSASAAANQSKSAFLAAMSHELRTPLNAVIGFSDMLASEIFGSLGDSRNQGYVKDIHASGTHLLSLINDILDLARIDAGEGKLVERVVHPQDLITDCLRMVTPQANSAGIRLVRDTDQPVFAIRADERRLKQVLINLLGNAVKFTPAQGQVSIRMRQNQHGLTICVADTGIGMAEKDIPVALEQFGQIDSALARKFEGAGLGLPIAKQLVELHGGTLAIESALNVGTSVTIFLPAERLVVKEPAVAVAAG